MERLQPLLQYMYDHNAPDLLLTAKAAPQIRVGGVFVPIEGTAPLTPADVETLLREVTNEEKYQRFVDTREFDSSFGIEGLSRFRLNAFYQRGSMAMAIRMIPFDIPQIDSLGLPPSVIDFVERPNGLVLVTGPTGSGKSTTLASAIDYINKHRQCHIVTIEDPIEFLHQNRGCIVNQREIGSDTHSFPDALRHVLRQTPDVILIGEMRDLETIAAALTLAETGHLVLATLHTQSATHAVSRIIDVFPAEQQQQIRIQLSEVLVGVVAQKLVQTVDGGLALAAEVMAATSGVRSLIREENTHQLYSAIQTGAKAGMVTMNISLRDLIKQKRIHKEEAMLNSNNPTELANLVR
jgi:twitching motility protein PilT